MGRAIRKPKSRLNTTRRQGEFNFGEPKDNGPTCTEDAPAAYHVSEVNNDAVAKKAPIAFRSTFFLPKCGVKSRNDLSAAWYGSMIWSQS